jgi:hypothetical protein
MSKEEEVQYTEGNKGVNGITTPIFVDYPNMTIQVTGVRVFLKSSH